MEPLPRRIVSPGSGAKFVVFASPLSGDGSPLTYGCALPPQSECQLSSVDPSMAMTFVVGQGVLELILVDNSSIILTSGEQLSVQPGILRVYRNPNDQIVCFVTTAAPGTLLERCLRERCEVGQNDKEAAIPTAPRIGSTLSLLAMTADEGGRGTQRVRRPKTPMGLFAHQMFGHGRTVRSPVGAL